MLELNPDATYVVGVKLAAHRAGVKLAIIPEENARDLQEIPQNIRQQIEIKTVKWIEEVIELALERSPYDVTKNEQVVDDEAKSKGDDAVSNVTAH